MLFYTVAADKAGGTRYRRKGIFPDMSGNVRAPMPLDILAGHITGGDALAGTMVVPAEIYGIQIPYNRDVFSKRAVPDKGRWLLGKGKTSFLVKRSFPLPQTPTLFKKSGVFCKVESSSLLEIIYPYGEQSLSKIQ